MGLVFVLIFAWMFSGWPQIGNFPPEIQEALAVCESSPCSYTTVGSDTFTVPAYDELTVTVWGGGGGGGGAGSASTDGQTGGQSSFDSPTSLIANGGSGGSKSNTPGVGGAGGAGGTASGGDTNTTGNSGVAGVDKAVIGGAGGDAPNGGTGGAGGSKANGSPGGIPCAGAGGGGHQAGGSKYAAGGGGSGGYTTKTFTAGQLTGSINVAVGGGGNGGSGDTSGGSGARGQIDISWTVPGPITTFLIGGTETGTKDTGVATITFPADAPESTICAPYNNVDGSGDPQFLSADASAPVVKIKNTGAATYNITLEITTWTNSIVNMESYNLATDGATNISVVTSELSNASGAARSVATGVSIDAGTYKDLYLKLLLGSVAGKTGTSTLTVLGETP